MTAFSCLPLPEPVQLSKTDLVSVADRPDARPTADYSRNLLPTCPTCLLSLQPIEKDTALMQSFCLGRTTWNIVSSERTAKEVGGRTRKQLRGLPSNLDDRSKKISWSRELRSSFLCTDRQSYFAVCDRVTGSCSGIPLAIVQYLLHLQVTCI
ncbi:hypothetical protein AUEXF2481DRAFT_422640 [Aureobasidium subglaciale EXF-2481]|uniref:Uncharacterized protein n=1 Tax=Aureobasidium subglaciale (strain EXF-2481) TaxID=1043005 RepID=A0A074Z0E1_AURSE|nr:uncharacterized protein AUEXF2481DRAFT_422640 [Aureobasidium subglaciale EXF-2481]KEQ92556.1 hypothetical protein AUEXF2481DRAFT_422640 [Aureobasidium subglaciale EXF-2481]